MARSDPGESDPNRDFGIVLGWESDPAGERIALKLQSARKVPECSEDVREFRYFLTREQAVQLGQTLFALSGATAPRRRGPDWVERLFGR